VGSEAAEAPPDRGRWSFRTESVKSGAPRADPITMAENTGTNDDGPGQGAQGVKHGVRTVLASPIAGFAPWIAFSVLEGPKRYEMAIGVALVIAVLELVLGILVGARAKLLDIAAIVFFVGLLIAGARVHAGGQAWLDRWSGELSNVMLVLVALISIAVRSPFTIQYAREMTPRETWHLPLFIHINYVITWVWTGVFALTALIGWYGDGPLNQPDNIWTNWIIQIALLVFAIRFTDWYPEVAKARALAEAAGSIPGRYPVAGLLLPLAGYLVPIGIVVLVFGGAPSWVGIALIVIGAGLAKLLHGEASGSGSQSAESRPGTLGV
jgi:hypothetical protein